MRPFLFGLASGVASTVVLLCLTLGTRAVLGDAWAWPPNVTVWGTIGDWASSIFAGLSVLVAFLIVLRDRDKESWAEARKVVATCTPEAQSAQLPNGGIGPRSWLVKMTLKNNTDAPIQEVVFTLDTKDSSKLVQSGVLQTDVDEVMPGDKARATFRLEAKDERDNTMDLSRIVVDSVRFRTYDGVVWNRRGSTGVLTRVAKSGRFNLSRR